MNLHEYLTQEKPQRLAPCSVKIESKDLRFNGFILNNNGLKMECVTLIKLGFNYIILGNSGGLWTMNEKGLPKEQSVFFLI